MLSVRGGAGRHGGGRYAVRIDADRLGVHSWLITLEGRSGNGLAAGRADVVSDALDELLHQMS